METERSLGFDPTDRELEKLGYDIESRVPDTGKLRFIEVEGRISGASTVMVTCNENLYSLNKPEDFILAIVEFLNDGGHRGHRVHYVISSDSGGEGRGSSATGTSRRIGIEQWLLIGNGWPATPARLPSSSHSWTTRTRGRVRPRMWPIPARKRSESVHRILLGDELDDSFEVESRRVRPQDLEISHPGWLSSAP